MLIRQIVSSSFVAQASVEPLGFLYFTGIAIFFTSSVSALYFKICMQSCWNQSVDCSAIERFPAIQDQIQAQGARWQTYVVLAFNVPSALACVLISAWSDAHGRKLNFLISISGSALMALLYIYSIFDIHSPIYIIPAAGFLIGFSGLSVLFGVSGYQYLADSVLDRRMLTVRMSIFTCAWSLGYVVGGYVAAVVLQKRGFAYTFLCALALLLLSAVYCLLAIHQKRPDEWRRSISVYIKSGASALSQPRRPAVADQASDLVRQVASLLRQICRSFTKERPGRCRAYIAAGTVSCFFFSTVDQGVDVVATLFLYRSPLQFSPSLVSVYWSLSSLLQMGGSLLSALLLKKLHVADTAIILLSMASAAARMSLLAVSSQKWMVFVSMAAGSLSVVGFPAFDAFMASIVEPTEIGKILSGISIFSSFGPTFANLVYNSLYSSTIHFYPGFVFLFVAALVLISALVFAWIHVDFKRFNRKEASRTNQRTSTKIYVTNLKCFA